MALFVFRGLEFNKLRKIDAVIFFLIEAKNVDDAAHQRGFSTMGKEKRTSSIAYYIIC
jgi:hypothetical protein